ncbi:MAG: response regulator transcription factor [Ruminococcaceae bacterium]|jgi:DNA-binding response OmpR family regulator|nr:response regulator transcription factor [Oscillospiraceae bacterium]
MRVLIAEDTKDLNRAVTVLLTQSGYDVDPVFDGEAALEKIEENGYDAVLLDIMMPKRDGLSVLREMRGRNVTVPVLMLTAKTEIDDRVEGLSAGADDYLTKPFAMKELLARVNAMTRRRTAYESPQVSFGDFSVDGETLELRAENAVRLSLREYELLRLFITQAERELDEKYILEHIWSREPEADGDTVFLYVSYLRRKLAEISSRAEICGERGGAYRLTGKAAGAPE